MGLIDNIGLLCLAINSSENQEVIGRTRMQKMIYFCKYLDWDVDDYILHYYGPFSFGLADTIKTAESSDLINQSDSVPYTFSLTEAGNEFLHKFISNLCDKSKVKKTQSLIEFLSDWSKEELEIVATIDFVHNSNYELGKEDLLNKVSDIKSNFTPKTIKRTYELWLQLKKEIR